MANHQDVNGVFLALADPTRREVVRTLGRGPASVGELAQPFAITLPSFMKHIRTLEDSGLIHTSKSGRVRTCTLDRDRLAVVGNWLDEQQRVWDGRTDRLEPLLTDDPQEQARVDRLEVRPGGDVVTSTALTELVEAGSAT